jgi:hypothetical protein
MNYTDTHPNVAYTSLKFLALRDHPEDLVAEIEGRCIYDPRDDSTSTADDTGLPNYTGLQRVDDPATWVYSANSALILADYHQKYRSDYEGISWDDVALCADYCDEDLGGGAKRSEIGYVIKRRAPFENYFNALRAYALCLTYFDGDTLVMVPDKPRTYVATLYESDIVKGSLKFDIDQGDDTPDQTIVRYTKTDSATITGAIDDEYVYEPWTESTAQTDAPRGGVLNPQVLPMSGWQSYEAAKRFAIKEQNRANLIDFTGSLKLFDEGLNYVPGDVLRIYHSRGLGGKLMQVIRSEAYELSRYQLQLEEYQDVWVDTVETEPQFDGIDIPSPSDFPSVTIDTPVLEVLWTDALGDTHTLSGRTLYGWSGLVRGHTALRWGSDPHLLYAAFDPG